MSRSSIRVAVVQPALALGQIEANLRRVEGLARDAHREHNPGVIVLPEALTSPNVYAKVLRDAPIALDGPALQMLLRLAGDLDCVVTGGFLALRGEHAYGTYVLAEPDGTFHLHNKDIPTAWENNYYRGGDYYGGGDDDGVVDSPALGARVGLMSGWEWERNQTSRRVRNAGVELVLGGMCWPSMPTNWPGPINTWFMHQHGQWKRECRELPGQVARMVGVPVAHAAHVGPIVGETPFASRIPWPTTMIGESQICDRDGRILARLSEEDGEGYVSAEVALGPAEPLDEIGERMWVPRTSLVLHRGVGWHTFNTQGRLQYWWRHRRQDFSWQR